MMQIDRHGRGGSGRGLRAALVTAGAGGFMVVTVALAPAALAAVSPSNPGGCTTKADNPHPSGHVRGTINAVVHQDCDVPVAKNSVEAKLWETRWWGWDVIDGPAFSNENAFGRTSSVNVWAPCRNNHFRVTGFGNYLWEGVHYRSPEQSNVQYVSC